MEKVMFEVFEDLLKQYRPSNYNRTVPVSSIILGEESALLRVETASMASKVTVSEALDNNILIRENIVDSLEESLKDNFSVWDELSKL